MKGWAVRPRLCRSSSSGAPKNDDIVFSGVGAAKEGISDGNLGGIWINSSKTSKSDVVGRIDDGREDKVCGEQD
jgi:hypothetical protein